MAVFIAFWSALFIHRGSFAVIGVWPLLLGSLLIVSLGVVDDLLDLKPSVKLVGQLLAAVAFVVPAASSLIADGGQSALSVVVGGLVAVGWLTAMSNMFNIVDGLDGLATGIGGIASVPLFIIAWQSGLLLPALYAVALFGASLGFLRYNVNPARLFLGDTGGMLIGYVLGVVSLQLMKPPGSAMLPAAVLLVIAVPLLDTAAAVLRRVSEGRPIAQADAMHIHHQLLRHGYSMRRAVHFLYAVGALAAVAALIVTFINVWFGWIVVVLSTVAGLAWAARLGALGGRWFSVSGADRRRSGAKPLRLRKFESHGSPFIPSEHVEFGEETGKFRGIAK